MLEIREVKLKLRTSEKIAIAELRLRSNIPLKVAELRLRKFFLQVAELRDCGLQKKLRVPNSVYIYRP